MNEEAGHCLYTHHIRMGAYYGPASAPLCVSHLQCTRPYAYGGLKFCESSLRINLTGERKFPRVKRFFTAKNTVEGLITQIYAWNQDFHEFDN